MEALSTNENRTAALHSNASADWGTPEIGRRFAACVLRPAAVTEAIDLDYASSAYWNQWWPDKTRPTTYLDGSPGRDVLKEEDRRAAVAGKRCGSGFQNAPGLFGGAMVQQCWEVMEADHRTGWLDSGVWWGFSLEQLASLQGVGERSPLSHKDGITTLIPSRRARYVLHPEQFIAMILKKQGRRERGSKEWLVEQRQLEALRSRADDSPVTPPAPPHASYVTILWSRDKGKRRRQMEAARQFLKGQEAQERSLFQRVAIVGEIE